MDRPIMLGTTPFPLPLHLGHECIAKVVAIGDQVGTVRPGQLVVVPFQISCGTCRPCQAGRTGNCATVPPISMYGFGVAGGNWGGALADQLTVPHADAMLVPLPSGIDPVAAASVADNVCDGYRHIAPYLPALLDDDPDAEVLIVAGLSPRHAYTPSIPLYAGLVARALGARNIYLADCRTWVRETAERLGLVGLHPAELKRRSPAPLVADITASPKGLHLALSQTAPDGICSSAGGLHRWARIPALRCYARNVTLHIGRAHVRHLIPAVLDLMIEERLHPEKVTTNVAPLAEAPHALRDHLGSYAVKTILTA
jgi:alcohol dehydrogenase